jgi:hypothetical protein
VQRSGASSHRAILLMIMSASLDCGKVLGLDEFQENERDSSSTGPVLDALARDAADADSAANAGDDARGESSPAAEDAVEDVAGDAWETSESGERDASSDVAPETSPPYDAAPETSTEPCRYSDPCNVAQADCGPLADGCGDVVDCGVCPRDQICGGGGPNRCGTNPCTPVECAAQQCGLAGDGCGSSMNCGPCPADMICGGGGVPSQCGPPPTPCMPKLCAELPGVCGLAGDGCGGVLYCGFCTPPDI